MSWYSTKHSDFSTGNLWGKSSTDRKYGLSWALSNMSPFNNIPSRSLLSHQFKDDFKMEQTSGYKALQEHCIPALTPNCSILPWWKEPLTELSIKSIYSKSENQKLISHQWVNKSASQ